MDIYAVIFCYKCNSEGRVMDDTDDIIATKVVNKQLTAETLIESDLLTEIFTPLEVGTHVKLEVFNLRFSGVRSTTEDALLERIETDMTHMLNTNELTFISEFDMVAKVSAEN